MIRRFRPLRHPVVPALALVALAAGALPASLAFARGPQAAADLVTQGGLHTVHLELEEATVLLHLPEDLVPGEPISGAVTVAPRGDTDKRRTKASRRLEAMALKVGGLELPLETAAFRGAIVCENVRCGSPTEHGAPSIPIRLHHSKGDVVAEVWVPLAGSAEAPKAGYRYRPVGVTGFATNVEGTFDGDFTTTRIEISGQRARILAESPRHAFPVVPEGAVGLGRIELRETGRALSGPFRGLGVALQPGKPALRPGERTTLTLRILGLDRLTAEMPIQLVSHHPGRVMLESGAVQTLHVHPTELQVGGVYQWIGTLQGTGGGPVDVGVSTHHSRPEQHLIPETPRAP